MFTSQISSKIEGVVDGFSNLKKVVISHPKSVQQFPHLSSIHSLKLTDIPIDCDDWQWLANVKDLNEFELSVKGADGTSGTLQVHNSKANIKSSADTSTISTLATVMSHLPMTLTAIDSSVKGGATNPGSLNIANGEVILTCLVDFKIIAAFASILAYDRITLTKVDVSILGSDTEPCRLSVDCKKVELNDVKEDETLLGIVRVLGNLPEYMRKEVRFTANVYFVVLHSTTDMLIDFNYIKNCYNIDFLFVQVLF